MAESFTAFLSHSYSATEVNGYFFTLFSGEADVQFEVDVGSFPTNVTRLERMVRNVDGFLGIYPFPGLSTEPASAEALRQHSRYFRLELDLALRSRIPALVCYDRRYGNLLHCTAPVTALAFDAQEITGRGNAPSRAHHLRAFQGFYREVLGYRAYRLTRPVAGGGRRVGLLLPMDGPAYSPDCVALIERYLSEANFDCVTLRWPPVLDRRLLVEVHNFDFAIVDVGEAGSPGGLVSFLHGQFIPMLRLRHALDDAPSSLERLLFGAFEVGYGKDVVRWSDAATLEAGLRARLEALLAPVERIATQAQAETYFRRSALRKEQVFLSYARPDQDVAAVISRELQKRFRSVFDYRDGRSLLTGQPWRAQVFGQLQGSAVAVPLLSNSYLASSHCLEELNAMLKPTDAGAPPPLVAAMKLYDEKFERQLPAVAEPLQYFRYYLSPDPVSAADEVVDLLRRASPS